MKSLSLIILSLLILSCENNPYDLSFGAKDPYPNDGNLRTEERAPQKDPADALSMTLAGQYELFEGTVTDFRIKAEAPVPYIPIITVDNLPAGASFDPETFVFSWKPGFFDGNLPGDPTIKSRYYPITVWLTSTKPDSEKRVKEVVLIVNDVPLNLDINGDKEETGYEGSEFVYDLDITNPDYPNGPFSVTTEGLPANSKIVKVSDKEFQIIFSPDYHHVLLNENENCNEYYAKCFKYTGKVHVYNPANHKTSKDVVFKVHDKRRSPKLVVPSPMKQGLDITFQVSAYDMNGEVAPDISLGSNEPDYGEFTTKLVKDEINNSSVLNITWKDVPPSYNGKTHSFEFETCVLDSKKRYRNCSTEDTTVSIEVKDRKAPRISRSDWAAGEIKYLDHDSSKSFDIYVSDGNDRWEDIRDVKIMPEQMRKFVTWEKDTLRVRFNKPGIHQFSIVAKSEYNMTSAESFVAEVFEEDRSRTLYFTDSTRDPEVKFFKDVMGNVTLMNPVLQMLNERNLSGRDTLILGTGILTDVNMKSNIANAMAKIRNIVVASALVEHMPEKFIDELQLEHNIAILGRYNELPNVGELSKMKFVARDDFEQPNNYVLLKRNSSLESVNPLIFSVGVDRNGCEDVLDLTDENDEARLKIGIICNRKSGGRYAILGTEFADLKTKESDTRLPAKWLRRMLTTSLNNKEVK